MEMSAYLNSINVCEPINRSDLYISNDNRHTPVTSPHNDIFQSETQTSPNFNMSNDNERTSSISHPHDMFPSEPQIRPNSCTSNDKQNIQVDISDRNPTTSAKPKIHITRKPPALDKETWSKYDMEFNDISKMSWEALRKGKTTPEQFVSDINGSLASFLESKPEFQKESKQFFDHKPSNTEKLETMRKLKIYLNKKSKLPGATETDKINARESVITYSHILRINREKEKLNLAIKEEKMYQSNFWKTAKYVTQGTFGEQNSAPTFSKVTAQEYYKEKYEKHVEVNTEDLTWFPQVEKPTKEYNLDPYTPTDIKHALGRKDKTSAPGFNDIVYEFLLKLPSLHKPLATAFTQIRDDGIAPDSWGTSRVILIKKSNEDPDNNPSNFRMISLTLNIGKLYHTMEAERALQFMLDNKYLDQTAQKAYVEGVNGCIEHTIVVHEVIQHAKFKCAPIVARPGRRVR